MGCFAIKIIISNHILSFKKVLKKCENWQKIGLGLDSDPNPGTIMPYV